MGAAKWIGGIIGFMAGGPRVKDPAYRMELASVSEPGQAV